MGIITKHKPVKLVISIIFREEKFLDIAEERLKKIYGPVDPLEKVFPFDFTDYYKSEFGAPLKRKILCFKKHVPLESVYKIKIRTNGIENNLRIGKKRTVNIDPGYVTEAKLVLLTTKDYSHRIHILKGIFAESTLCFKSGSFCAWPWTYPDYASAELVAYFNEVREIYRRDIGNRR